MIPAQLCALQREQMEVLPCNQAQTQNNMHKAQILMFD